MDIPPRRACGFLVSSHGLYLFIEQQKLSMPDVFISSDLFANGVLANLAGDNFATGFLSGDATAGSFTSSVFFGFGTDQDVTIAGAALSSSASAVFLSGVRATLNVTQSGQVTNTNNDATAAVHMGNSGASVVNHYRLTPVASRFPCSSRY